MSCHDFPNNYYTYQDIEGELEFDAYDRWEVYRAQHLSCH